MPSRPNDADSAQAYKKRKGLSYREQREWEQMEQHILQAEETLTACQAAVDDPAIVSDAAALQSRHAALHAALAEVERLYARWAELEEKRAASVNIPLS
jgi:ATP-binding cassette subfamily F protein uup